MEVEILHHLGEGRSPKEIGHLTCRDRTSCHYHIKNLRRRFKARHMLHLAVIAATDPLRAEVEALRSAGKLPNRATPDQTDEEDDILWASSSTPRRGPRRST